MGFVAELLAVLALSCITFWWYWYKNVFERRKKLNWLRKRPGLPILGSALEFTAGSTEHLKTLSKMIDDTGEAKCAYVEFLYRSVLVVSDYKLLEFVLGSNSLKLLNKSEDYLHLRPWLGTGLLTAPGKKWKTRRRILTPAFHFQILEQFIDIFERNGHILVDKLNKIVGQNSVDIFPYISLCALDIICETAMGVSIKAQNDSDSEYVRSVKEMCRIIVDRAFSPIEMFDFLYRFCKNSRLEAKALDVLHSKTERVIQQRRQELEASKKTKEDVNDLGIKRKKAFLDLLLESTIDGKPLSNLDIREEVDTFMFEGHDTTATAMCFALYELAYHPEVQQKILEEQQKIVPEDRDVTYRDLQEMKYLENVIKEVLRLYPSVPLFARCVEDDIEYEEGKIIPKDTTVLLIPFYTNRDATYFKDPEKFDPSRFEDITGTSPYSYFPFSAGPRNCIGQKFAMLEMKSTIAKIVKNFELLPSIPDHKLILAAETVLKSANGVRIRLNKRVRQ